MLSMSDVIAVRLHRDTLSMAWGFRLTGGKDVKAPLVVQRVSFLLFGLRNYGQSY